MSDPGDVPRAQVVGLNGRLVDRGEARISPFDRGFLYGDGFFETTRVHGGVAVFLDRHLARLAASCRDTGFGWAPDPEALSADVAEVIRANRVAEGYLRVTVSRGPYEGRLTDLAAVSPTVLVEARPMALAPLDAPEPIVIARSPYRREGTSPIVRHKSLSYQLNALALAEGRARGADEVYFLNSDGRLAEGAVSNLFFAAGGVVCTPDASCGLLPGITRGVVLELCDAAGITAEEGAYAEADMLAADEVFCTNALRGVMAVRSLLDHPGKGLSSDVTRRIQSAYAELVRRDCERGRGG